MKIEHVAFMVPDPAAFAAWYRDNLAFVIKRAMDKEPFTTFIADASGSMLIEVYNNPTCKVPDYKAQNPLLLHLAFQSSDMDADLARLQAAGATVEWPREKIATGDEIVMLRDPWGLSLQVVKRVVSML